jgi:hypothetical protein
LVKQKFLTVQPNYNKLRRGRELTIVDLFDSWEISYEMLPSLLAAIQSSTYGTKIHHRDIALNKFDVENIDRVA